MTTQNWYMPDEPSKLGSSGIRSSLLNEFDQVREEVTSAIQNIWNMLGPGGIGCNNVLGLPEEYDSNPVLNPATDRAYFPTLLYFANGFDVGGTPYKYLCIHSSDEDAGGGLLLAGSQDFKTWTQLNGGNPLVGIPAAASHAFVVQVAASSFRLYYWDSTKIYTVAAIRTAVSTDLINWTNDQPLQNGVTPIVTGVGGDWNYGTYGASHVIYNPDATNAGTNPFDYTYAMYYDGTTGNTEDLGLAYSSDGITFTLYGRVLTHGSATPANPIPWDSRYSTWAQIIRLPSGMQLMFYSGGAASANEGVGTAISSDGLTWTKLNISAPLIARVAGTWRDNRCYTPSLLTDYTNRFSGAGDVCDVKMLISGRSAGGDYTCGYFKIPSIYVNSQEVLLRLGRL